MNYKVMYFTRTGISKKVAEKIAAKLGCELIQITDNMNWQGPIGFLKGGYYASQNKTVGIKIHGNIDDVQEFIVVTPLWAGKVVPAIQTFLKTISLDKVHLVVTSNGSTLQNRSGYKSVSDIVKRTKNEDDVINALTASLI